MGKVEEALRGLMYRHGKRAASELLGDLPAQVRRMRREVRALTRTVKTLAAELKAVSKARRKEMPVPPASEGEVEKSRFTKRTLKSMRKRCGLTQHELAGLLGVSPVTVASWESAKSRPRKGKLAQIIALRSMDRAAIDEVMGREPAPPAITAAQIKRLRSTLGLTQATLAKAVGVSAAAVTSWESGRTTPGPENRKALAAMAAGADAQAGEKPAAAVQQAVEARQMLSPEAIRGRRKKAGLSQAKMAKALGVSLNTISNWETGRSTPRARSLAKLLRMQD